MFEATIENVSVLRDSIATISELIDETQLRLSDEGIKMVSADRAVVVVVDFMLSKSAFSNYKCEKETNIGINLVSMHQILNRAGTSDRLTMKLEDNKLHFRIDGNEYTRSFSLPLIDISTEEAPNLEKLDFPTSLRVNSDLLSSGIEDAEMITDSVVFTVRKDRMIIKAESDSSSAQLDLNSGTDSLKINNVTEPIRSRYSLDYLKKMVKAKKLAKETEICMATDYPMKMVFSQPDIMSLSFVLAPRVEE